MKYLDRLVLAELAADKDPAVRAKARELLILLGEGKTSDPMFAIKTFDKEVPLR